MGGFSSSDFKDTHVLHFLKFCDNKLYVYLPHHDRFYSFLISNRGKKFRFFAQESISLPSGAIYLVGGQTSSYEEDSDFRGHDGDPSSLYMTNFVAKINLKKHKDFQIELQDMKPCRVLPEPRSSHLMVYNGPYIFVIGGFLDKNISTRSCRRFHIKRKAWESISDINLTANLTDTCGITIKDSIYVFDTGVKSGLPRIYQYSIELNFWQEILIQHKNRTVSIPSSFSCSIFQTSDNELIIMSGVCHQDTPKGFYYTYNIETEELSDITANESSGIYKKERQGNTNYSQTDLVFTRLNERSVRAFRKSDKRWVEMELTLENSISSDFGCCSRKK